jgi:hypothetical protein
MEGKHNYLSSEILSVCLLERELKLCQVLSACLFIATVNLDLEQQTLNCELQEPVHLQTWLIIHSSLMCSSDAVTETSTSDLYRGK